MRTATAILLITVLPISASAWGEKGHLMVNRLAIEAAASKLPEFMNSAREHIIYNAYEPDRWREEARTPMNYAQEVEHFFDSEKWGPISTLPTDRILYVQELAAKKGDFKTGYLPYAIIENYGKLVNAFRRWRNAKTPSDRESARANAVYIAGVMGHYVGDGSQPMHMTIHHHGWEKNVSNPKNFTREYDIHNRYETAYVDAAIDFDKVRPGVQSPQRLSNVWNSIKQYLTQTFSELEPMYELEKTGEFNPQNPRAMGTEFIQKEIARAGTMLGNLWYTAWLESGEPAPSARAAGAK